MNPRILISTAVASLSLVFAVSCSSHKKEDKKVSEAKAQNAKVSEAIAESAQPNKPTTVQTQPMNDQVDFAKLEFDKGEAKISEMDRRHLNELAMKMTGPGKVVDDIKILTWSDRTVGNDLEASNTEIILARQRAESIKKYLERTLPADEDIDFYNMAENPERYTKYMERKGIPVEQAFNESDKETTDGKALVIIEYQSGPTPSQL